MADKVKAFLEFMAPLAVADMAKSGILASVTIAQGILESAWGTSELAVNAKNYFGMKENLSGNTWPGTSWNGETYTKETKEQRQDGTSYTITAKFRKYQEAAQSVADHSAYLTGAKNRSALRYAGLKGEKDARTAVTIIKNGGYATDVKYIDKVMDIIEKYDLTQYDKESGGETMKEVKFMLDAGHDGKYNRSPAVKAYYESDFTFKFCNMLKEELAAYGIKADTTRKTQDEKKDLFKRGYAAKGYDLFISIHSNATGSGVNDSVDYPVAITMVNDSKVTIDEESKAIGEKLAQVVAEVMQTKQKAKTYTKLSSNDRDGNGIKDDEYYGVLNGAKRVKVPGIILEHSFHTNTRATNWLLDDNNLRKMAKAEAAVLAEHYGISKKEEPEPEKTPAQAATWYRVRKTWADSKSQVGAYKVYGNAVKACPEGYAVFDDNGKELYRNAAACVYVVKSGDTLGKIAKKYSTSVDKIVKDNKTTYPKITANYIVVGWKLVIK